MLWRVSEAVIETEGLVKRFGRFVALNALNLRLLPGAIGLLGPNGAGKSTLIKCLLRLHSFQKGKAQLLGRDVRRHGREIRRRVGYTPEQDCHIPGMAGCEYVTYCGQLSGLPFRVARQRAHEMLDFVGMGQERYRKIETYSTGMRQRLKLAQAIVHDPLIVFLDEPTNGLDPQGQARMLDLIQSLWRVHNITVVLSTHLLPDVDRICEEIVLLGQGKILVQDSLKNLKAKRRGAAQVLVEDREEELLSRFTEVGWPCKRLPNGHIRVEHGETNLDPLLQVARELGITLLEAIPSPNALEEMFVQALAESDGDT